MNESDNQRRPDRQEPNSVGPPPICTRHTQCIAADGHSGPCSVPAWSEVWQRD